MGKVGHLGGSVSWLSNSWSQLRSWSHGPELEPHIQLHTGRGEYWKQNKTKHQKTMGKEPGSNSQRTYADDQPTREEMSDVHVIGRQVSTNENHVEPPLCTHWSHLSSERQTGSFGEHVEKWEPLVIAGRYVKQCSCCGKPSSSSTRR